MKTKEIIKEFCKWKLGLYEGIILKNKRLFLYIHFMKYADINRRQRTEIEIVKFYKK